MPNNPIKKVEYDKNLCEFSHDVICPYCNTAHNIDGDHFTDQNTIYECSNCERHFAFETEYTINFHSRPLENYYLDERERLLKARTKYEGIYNPEPHIRASMDIINNQLQNLENDKKDYLDDPLRNKRSF